MNQQQRRQAKKIFCLLLTLAMLLTLLPSAGLAEAISDLAPPEGTETVLDLLVPETESDLVEETTSDPPAEENLDPLPLEPNLEQDSPVPSSQSASPELAPEVNPMAINLGVHAGNITLTGNGTNTYYEQGGAYVSYTGELTLTGSTDQYTVSVNSGTHKIILNGVDISSVSTSPFKIAANAKVNLTLADGTNNSLNASETADKAGLQVPDKAELIITSSGNGTLIVEGGENGAGIGGSYEHGGTITLNGGIIEATGGRNAAGIGGGGNGASGIITINGGQITADSQGYGAGIGTGSNGAGGTIEINGGTIDATGGNSGAGIGGGSFGFIGKITIKGGQITAAGRGGGAGIGGGYGEFAAEIKLSGGTINATGNDDSRNVGGAGIGGGYQGSGGNITIQGGTINAQGGTSSAGIGCGNNGIIGSLTINGGNIQTSSTSATPINSSGTELSLVTINLKDLTVPTAVTAILDSSGQEITTGTVKYGLTDFKTTNNGQMFIYLDKDLIPSPARVEADYSYEGSFADGNRTQTFTLRPSPNPSVELSALTGNLVLRSSGSLQYSLDGGTNWKYYSGALTLTGSTDEHTVSVNSGEHQINLMGINISSLTNSPLAISSGAKLNLNLADKTDNRLQAIQTAGLLVPEGSDLVIQGTGNLFAEGGLKGAGIGGDFNQACGSITLTNGRIEATGGAEGGAGIGGGDTGNGGQIQITGGTIIATGKTTGAGIGGGNTGNGGQITISGGMITATSETTGAGIGGGDHGAGGQITLTGGSIMAKSKTNGAGIGGGYSGNGGTVVITGGNVLAVAGYNTNRTIGAGKDGTNQGSLQNSNGVNISLVTINLLNLGTTSQVTKIVDTNGANIDYNLQDFKTLGERNEQLFIYLPQDSTPNPTKVELAGGTVYSGSFSSSTDRTQNFKIIPVIDLSSLTPGNQVFLTDSGTSLQYSLDSGSTWIDYNGELTLTGQTNSAAVTILHGRHQVTLSSAGITAPSPFTILNQAELTMLLTDGTANTLTANSAGQAGLQVTKEARLIINSQSSGQLIANGAAKGAGIGGGSGQNSGMITLKGGIIEANGGVEGGAGIGGGYLGNSGTITIENGTITATGKAGGAGIGGGSGGMSQGTISIKNGNIIAKSMSGGAGIGGGQGKVSLAIEISGGTITAIGGAANIGIGYGYADIQVASQTTISGGNIKAIDSQGQSAVYPAPKDISGNLVSLVTINLLELAVPQRIDQLTGAGTYHTGFKTLDTNKLYLYLPSTLNPTKVLSEGYIYSGQVSGSPRVGDFRKVTASTIDLSALTNNLVLRFSDGLQYSTDGGTTWLDYLDKITLTGSSGQYTVSVQNGTHQISLNQASITSASTSPLAIAVGAEVKLTLLDGTVNSLNASLAGDKAGLQVPEGASLVITSSGTGELKATGGALAAGIGGSKDQSGGTITVNGGTITATGGNDGAGIGSGNNAGSSIAMLNGGLITINGGIITANGVSGIGGGSGGNGGTITINDGNINANGLNGGAGIGGGSGGNGGLITINDGTITAKSNDAGAGIGGGYWGHSGTIKITGGTIMANGKDGGAGIGSGESAVSNTIIISGGQITAQGGDYAAGIGSGIGADADIITIEGGIINATGGLYGAGIGAGMKDGENTGNVRKVKIDGGAIIANGGTQAPGIGGGGEGGGIASIEINGGNIKAAMGAGAIPQNKAGTALSLVNIKLLGLNTAQKVTDLVGAGSYQTGFNTLDTNQLYLYLPNNLNPTGVMAGEFSYSGQVSGNPRTGDFQLDTIINLSALTNHLVLRFSGSLQYSTDNGANWTNYSGRISLLGSTNQYTVSVQSGTHAIILNNAEITSTTASPLAINSGSQVNLTLKTGTSNSLNASGAKEKAGLQVPEGASLVISSSGTGELIAVGGDYGAGIGSYYGAGGQISIAGGTITATGGESGAGIGGGYHGAGGTITISGQAVITQAQGGNNAAGIGGGHDGAGGQISIAGGTITATGGELGAGIGGGNTGAGGTITISGQAVITQAQGGYYAAGIGGGYQGAGGQISIAGGTITATGGEYGAGIGGGNNGAGSTIEITGGTITATGGNNGAGIGGGSNAISTDLVTTIKGGTITAKCGMGGAGIGGGLYGNGGTVVITGGNILATGDTARGAENIGKGEEGTSSGTLKNGTGPEAEDLSLVNIKLLNLDTTQKITALIGAGNYQTGFNTLDTNQLYLYLPEAMNPTGVKAGNRNYGGQVSGNPRTGDFAPDTTIIDLATMTKPIALRSSGSLQYSLDNGAIWTDYSGEITLFGTTTQSTVSVQSGTHDLTLNSAGIISSSASPLSIAAKAKVNLNLTDNTTNVLTVTNAPGEVGTAGLLVPEGASVVIDSLGGGELKVTGGGYSAGIGGGSDSNNVGGNITIKGGIIAAQTGNYGAGIGGGREGAGGQITIEGGIITATGGFLGAGIGGGTLGAGGEIKISGGTIKATGKNDGAGIGGGGESGAAGSLEITGGNVQASSISAVPKNKAGTELSLVNITLVGLNSPTAITSLRNSSNAVIPYGLTNFQTLGANNNQLLIYLPQELTANLTPAKVRADGFYIGTLEVDRTGSFQKVLSLDSAALNLTESLNLIYTATIPADHTDPYMIFNFLGTSSGQVKGTLNSSGEYEFSFKNITPQYMVDGINATLYANHAGSKTSVAFNNYNIRTYGQNMLLSYADKPNIVSLVSDLLNYGAKAQLFTNYNPYNLAIDGVIGLNITNFTGISDTKRKTKLEGTANSSGDWKRAGLYLGDSMAMYFDFSSNDLSGLVVKTTINGRTSEFSQFSLAPDSSGYYRIYLREIMADEFDQAVTATFWKGGTQIGQTLTYSVNSYAYSMQNDAEEEFKNIVRAIYNYGVSAENYAANPEI